MKTDVLLRMAIDFSILSLVAIGGANAIAPEMHRQLVDVLGWMNDSEFANLFALGQVAPGPNIMVLSLVGWKMAGISGLVVATLAALIPTCALAWITGRFVARYGRAAWFDSIKAGLTPIAIGLVLSSSLVMARAAERQQRVAARFPHASGYVAPFGFLQRVRLVFDPRQTAYFIELRSGPEGHFSYRQVALDMLAHVRNVSPLFARFIRAKEGDAFLGRLDSEMTADERRQRRMQSAGDA